MKLTQNQINSLIEMNGAEFTSSHGTDRNPLVVQFNRWTKGNKDRLYINKVSGGGLAKDFGHNVGYIDLLTGEIHGDNWYAWMQRVREELIEEVLES